jgi:malate permease and related proteins
MHNILLVFVCLLVGVGFQFVKSMPKNMHTSLNQLVIYASMPALGLYYIPKVEISSDLLFAFGLPWVGFGLSFLFFYTLGRYLGWSNKLIGFLIVTMGLGNTAFVGFPIIKALYGTQGLQTAIIIDQPGTFVVMATLGVLVATLFSREKLQPRTIFLKIISFPPFIAFAISLALILLKLDFPPILQEVFNQIGATVTPIALVAVGLQLKIEKRSQHWKFLILGLFFKLILTPLFFFILYRKIFHLEGLWVDVCLMEAAMAPMISGVILTTSYGMKPKLGSMMIGIGIPLSFISLAFWYWVINTF